MKTTRGVLDRTATAKMAGPNRAVPETWQRHYQRLLELRSRIAQDANELTSDSGEAGSRFSMHMADAATDSFDRDLAYSLLSMEDNALAEIDAALQRIRDCRYGLCEKTGEPIPRKRLDALPWARYTIKAQAELEAEGRAPHAHLNPVASVRSDQTPSKE